MNLLGTCYRHRRSARAKHDGSQSIVSDAPIAFHRPLMVIAIVGTMWRGHDGSETPESRWERRVPFSVRQTKVGEFETLTVPVLD